MFKQCVTHQNRQQGFTLLEALISVVILSFGLLAIGSFQAKLVAGSAHSKARAEAIALAQDKLDDLRSYTTEHGLVENLTNTYVDNPAPGNEFLFPADVPVGLADYPNPVAPAEFDEFEGTNATFRRQWTVNLSQVLDDAGNLIPGEISTVEVTVSWDERDGTQSVSLESEVSWRNPRGIADVGEDTKPLVKSPTGKAYLGDGSLTKDEMIAFKNANPDSSNNDGTYSADHDGDGDLELIVETADGAGEVVLTLPKACEAKDENGDPLPCIDFVRIHGTVFFDRTGGSKLNGSDIYVLASDAAYCSRWIPLSVSGTTLNVGQIVDKNTKLPTTDGEVYLDNDTTVDYIGNEDGSGDYDYFNYTCYLGGGWYGNIGLVMFNSNNQDYSCVGDPDAGLLDSWKQVELAKRRVYRGVIQNYTLDTDGTHLPVEQDGKIIRYSVGIADSTTFPDPGWLERPGGHNYVISNGNSPTTTDCVDVLSRPDANHDTTTDNLFTDVPDDFICLNEDGVNPPAGTEPRVGAYLNFEGYPWEYLNGFDIAEYDAPTDCPYDPSDPPSTEYTIRGILAMDAGQLVDSWGSTNPVDGTHVGNINTTDGFDNCIINSYTAGDGNDIDYSCTYYVWSTEVNKVQVETPWNGSVVVNSPADVVCFPSYQDDVLDNYTWQAVYGITDAIGTQTANFTCHSLEDYVVEGTITVDEGNNLASVLSGASFQAYDQNNNPIGSCTTIESAEDVTTVVYRCSGLMEENFTTGFTGRIEMVVPADHTCVSATAGVGADPAPTCSGSDIVIWSFTDLFTGTPDNNGAVSTGNDALLEGPMEVFTVQGLVNNDTNPKIDFSANETKLAIDLADAYENCTPSYNPGTGDVDYSCSVRIDTRLVSSWTGALYINPPDGAWCGTDTAGVVIDLNVGSDQTVSTQSCVNDTTGPVKVYGSVYVREPYKAWYTYPNVGYMNGDFDYKYQDVGFGSGDYILEYKNVVGGDYEQVTHFEVGYGSGDYVQSYDYAGLGGGTHEQVKGFEVGYGNGDYVQSFDNVAAVGGGTHEQVTHFDVGYGNGDYVQSFDYAGVGGGTHEQVEYEFVGAGSGDYIQAYDYVGTDKGSYVVDASYVGSGMGAYVDVFWDDVGPGNGDVYLYAYEFVPAGTGTHVYTFDYVYLGAGRGDYDVTFDLWPGGPYVKGTDALTGDATYLYVGWGNGTHDWVTQVFNPGLGSFENIPVFYPQIGGDAVPTADYELIYTIGSGKGHAVLRGNLGKTPWYKFVGEGNGDHAATYPVVTYRQVGANMGDYEMRDPIEYTQVAEGMGDFIKYPTPRYNYLGDGLGDWKPSYPVSYDLVGAGIGNYNQYPTPRYNYLGDGLGDWKPSYPVSYDFVSGGVGNYNLYPTPRYNYLGDGLGDWKPSYPVSYDLVSGGVGNYNQYPTPRYNMVGAGAGDWMPTDPPLYTAVAGQVGNYNRLPGDPVFVGALQGSYDQVENTANLVTFPTDTDNPLMSGTVNGTCTFDSVPVIPSPLVMNPAPQWHNFSCETNSDISHHQTWSGSVTVTTTDPWSVCQLDSYSNSWSNVPPSSSVVDAYSAVDYSANCPDYNPSGLTPPSLP